MAWQEDIEPTGRFAMKAGPGDWEEEGDGNEKKFLETTRKGNRTAFWLGNTAVKLPPGRKLESRTNDKAGEFWVEVSS